MTSEVEVDIVDEVGERAQVEEYIQGSDGELREVCDPRRLFGSISWGIACAAAAWDVLRLLFGFAFRLHCCSLARVVA